MMKARLRIPQNESPPQVNISVQTQTAVTAYLKSKQLLLFSFAEQNRKINRICLFLVHSYLFFCHFVQNLNENTYFLETIIVQWSIL